LHVAAGITYNHRGVITFYNDPKSPEINQKVVPRPPKRTKYDNDQTYNKRLADWHAEHTHPIDPQADIPPKGNAMTQRFYAKEVLPLHLEYLRWLEAKYQRKFYFQEDNDPSHGTRSTNNACYKAKLASGVQLLDHPAQSPYLNPIEGIWNIIKQRLRGSK
ncbi:hypothetical protein M501DRAFT_933278, partial [Patellaria atrata CBS 101060]